MRNMNGHLIISVDDFGFTQGINDAVRQLAHYGTISATNIMTTMPYVDAIQDVAADFPQLSIGVHINLTQGKPLLPPDTVPTLVDGTGYFYPFQTIRQQASTISVKDIRKEVEAQVSRARALLGERLDHWNSHQGIHRFRPFLGIISDICYQYQIPASRSHKHYFTRHVGQQLQLVHPNLFKIFQFSIKRTLTEMYYDLSALHLGRRFRLPEGLIAIEGGNVSKVLWIAIQHPLPPGYWEIACHPAITTEGLSQTMMLESRLREYELLSSDLFRDKVKANPEKLVGFPNI